MFRKIIEAHKFFVHISPGFMKGTNRVTYYLYYPIAYLKFMWYSYQDAKRLKN